MTVHNQTSWAYLLRKMLDEKDDSLVKLCIYLDNIPTFVPIDHYKFCAKFDDDYGGVEGCSFTAWGEKNVYFPCCYDGEEWIECVPRNPELSVSPHFGGG